MSYEKKYLPENSDITEEWNEREDRVETTFADYDTSATINGRIDAEIDAIMGSSFKPITTSITGKNLNDITETGFYSGVNVINSRLPNNISTYIVIKYNAQWITQVVFIPDFNDVYIRHMAAAVWTDWKKIT